MDEGLELCATAIDKVADKHGDKIYDKVTTSKANPFKSQQDSDQKSSTSKASRRNQSTSDPRQRHRAELPSPERETRLRGGYINNDDSRYDNFDQQSANSERVLRDYEDERDDPRRRPVDSAVGSAYSRRNGQRDKSYQNMSYNDYDRRPSSQQPPRSRYDDDDYSDYDDRTGKRSYRSGRGYDPDTGRDYDREIVETERYRGPARNWENARSSSYQNDDYAVAQYNRRSGDVAAYDQKRRSSSRGRRSGDYYDERDRDYDDHRDREHEHHERKDLKERLGDTFDTTPRGIGFGIAGAVVGGLAGRAVGKGPHQKRDMVIGALIGGLGANAAENKYHDWKLEKEVDRDDDRYDNRDYRSRSAMR